MSTIYWMKLLKPRKLRAIVTVEVICAGCKESFNVAPWVARRGRKFCSPECRIQDPLATMMSRIKKQENGCWNYTGTIGWGGYGQIKSRGVSYSTHKLMWVLFNKKMVPKGLVVRHTCVGNPACINPDHLIIGTQKENIQDIIRQGRFRSAFGTPVRKFSPEIVREIRALRKSSTDGTRMKPTYKEIAARYNTTDGAIWALVNFVTYKDVK